MYNNPDKPKYFELIKNIIENEKKLFNIDTTEWYYTINETPILYNLLEAWNYDRIYSFFTNKHSINQFIINEFNLKPLPLNSLSQSFDLKGEGGFLILLHSTKNVQSES